MASFFKLIGLVLAFGAVTDEVAQRRFTAFIWLCLLAVVGCFVYAFATGSVLFGLIAPVIVLFGAAGIIIVFIIVRLVLMLIGFLFRSIFQ